MIYPNLKNLKTLNVVLFVPGVGGAFVTNCLQLGDSETDFDQFRHDILGKFYFPVTKYAEHETTHQIESTRILWSGMLFDQSEKTLHNNLDFFFTDVEIGMLRLLDAFSRSDRKYFVNSEPLSTIGSIYISGHMSAVSDDPCNALDKVTAYATAHGINIRYLVTTVNSIEHRTWINGRFRTIFELKKNNAELDYEYANLVTCLEHPNAVELPIDLLLTGQAERFVDLLGTKVIGTLENRDILIERATAFYQNKVVNACPKDL